MKNTVEKGYGVRGKRYEKEIGGYRKFKAKR